MTEQQAIKKIEYDLSNRHRYGMPWAAKLVLSGNNVNFVYLQGAYVSRQDGGTLIIELEPGSAYAYGQKDFKDEQPIINYFGINNYGKELVFKNINEVREFLQS